MDVPPEDTTEAVLRFAREVRSFRSTGDMPKVEGGVKDPYPAGPTRQRMARGRMNAPGCAGEFRATVGDGLADDLREVTPCP